MGLIVESGAAKATWHYLSEDATVSYSWTSSGYNPAVTNHQVIENAIRAEVLHTIPQKILNKVHKMYFYGAGCTKYEAKDDMTKILQKCFPNLDIEVESDLLSAARATCGHEKGICCILGTGSNSCVYDGSQIVAELPALGYILSDEGCEIALGKRLLRDYLYELMPENLCGEFREKLAKSVKSVDEYSHNLPLNKQLAQKVIKMLYQGKSDSPNTYLAQFASFVDGKLHNNYIIGVVKEIFCEFIELRILPYFGERFGFDKTEYKIQTLGTVAFQLRAIWEDALKSYHLQVGDIIQTPFPKLSSYHHNKLK